MLGFLPSDKLKRFIELAATADAEIVIYGPAEPDEHPLAIVDPTPRA
ncbi:hypothetical protein [Nocardia amikacinitolerans]|nr:hypothetical protein [Nocardia amikacinitolerans]